MVPGSHKDYQRVGTFGKVLVDHRVESTEEGLCVGVGVLSDRNAYRAVVSAAFKEYHICLRGKIGRVTPYHRISVGREVRDGAAADAVVPVTHIVDVAELVYPGEGLSERRSAEVAVAHGVHRDSLKDGVKFGIAVVGGELYTSVDLGRAFGDTFVEESFNSDLKRLIASGVYYDLCSDDGDDVFTAAKTVKSLCRFLAISLAEKDLVLRLGKFCSFAKEVVFDSDINPCLFCQR